MTAQEIIERAEKIETITLKPGQILALTLPEQGFSYSDSTVTMVRSEFAAMFPELRTIVLAPGSKLTAVEPE